MPSTLYGVYKRANEGTAHVYWADHQVASLGLRPHTLLPFPPGADASGLEAIIGPRTDTPPDVAVAETIKRFRRLEDRGLLAPRA